MVERCETKKSAHFMKVFTQTAGQTLTILDEWSGILRVGMTALLLLYTALVTPAVIAFHWLDAACHIGAYFDRACACND